MTNEEKLFVTVKSDISNCICKIVTARRSAKLRVRNTERTEKRLSKETND